MSTRGDLVAFISSQLDACEDQLREDERVARAATPGPWRVNSEVYAETIYAEDGSTPVAGGRWAEEASVFDSDEDAIHIAHFDPRRMLAEVEQGRRDIAAKRAILDLYEASTDRRLHPDAWELMKRVVQEMGQVFSGADGYRPEWAPQHVPTNEVVDYPPDPT